MIRTETLLTIVFLLIGAFICARPFDTSPLRIIEQDYELARAEADSEGKLLFIDFYTDWCAPCKELDKLVFQNDSIAEILEKDVVLLRYDAENDTIFHLSKKHHVSSYPTGLILNGDGRVVSRKYGFAGEDAASLGNSVLKFVNGSIKLNKDNTFLTGYSADIDPTVYPSFYVDFINRTDTKIDSAEINDYLGAQENTLSEPYFSVLLYFAGEVSDSIADVALKDKDQYLALYGATDVETMMYFFVSGRFRRAVVHSDPSEYEKAIAFAEKSLSQEWLDDVLPSFERDYLKAQDRWDELFAIYREMKENGEMSHGYINHFSYQVYKECEDRAVINSCVEWMKEVVSAEPTFDYLDTYAFLTYKSGDKDAAKRIAQQAIEVGKRDDRKTASLEKLIDKIESDGK